MLTYRTCLQTTLYTLSSTLLTIINRIQAVAFNRVCIHIILYFFIFLAPSCNSFKSTDILQHNMYSDVCLYIPWKYLISVLVAYLLWAKTVYNEVKYMCEPTAIVSIQQCSMITHHFVIKHIHHTCYVIIVYANDISITMLI